MTTQTIAQPQNSDNRIQLIKAWQATTSEAIEALLIFRGWLKAWEMYPGSIPFELFCQVVDDLATAGLSDWTLLNKADIYALGQVMTAEEK